MNLKSGEARGKKAKDSKIPGQESNTRDNKTRDELDGNNLPTKPKITRVTFTETEFCEIPDDAEVKIYETNRKILKKYTWKKQGNLADFNRLTGNRYLDKRDSTIKQYSTNMYKTRKSIKDNMRHLKKLMNLYFGKYHNMFFITLTCGELVKDLKEIKKYWNRFIRKLKAKLSKYELFYIFKFEQNKDGRWHIHFVVRDRFNRKMFIKNYNIHKWWKEGFTYTQIVKKNGHIDVNYDQPGYDKNAKNNPTEKVSSYMAKTSQLGDDIPNNAKIWGHSSNIQMPKPIIMKNKDADKIIQENGVTVESEKTFDVNIEDKTINKHSQQYYNKKATAPKKIFTDFKETNEEEKDKKK